MLQDEFETLYGKKVGEDEFEVINALYMLDNNETKQEFVARYKKMGKDELMSAFVASNQRSKEYSENLRKEKEEAVARAMRAERENERLRNELRKYESMDNDFNKTYVLAKVIAVQCHSFDENHIIPFIEGECCRALGPKEYFTTIRDAGCEPSRNDLDMMIKYMEEK